MEGQHEIIERLNTEADEAAGAWRVNPAAESRERLANVFGQLIRALDEHMRLEEELILPLAEKYITAAEWHAMASESGRVIPQDKVPLVFGMTLYEASPGVIQKTLSELPAEVRTVLQEQGPRAFASHSERVYGTATPPRSGVVMRSWPSLRSRALADYAVDDFQRLVDVLGEIHQLDEGMGDSRLTLGPDEEFRCVVHCGAAPSRSASAANLVISRAGGQGAPGKGA